MGRITDIRYKNKSTPLLRGKELGITDIVVGEDSKGYFFQEGKLPVIRDGVQLTVHDDCSPVPNAVEVLTTATPAPHEPKARLPREGGAVARVHAFLKENPDMGRKEAVAALTALGINPSTASVQYGVFVRNKNLVVS